MTNEFGELFYINTVMLTQPSAVAAVGYTHLMLTYILKLHVNACIITVKAYHVGIMLAAKALSSGKEVDALYSRGLAFGI